MSVSIFTGYCNYEVLRNALAFSLHKVQTVKSNSSSGCNWYRSLFSVMDFILVKPKPKTTFERNKACEKNAANIHIMLVLYAFQFKTKKPSAAQNCHLKLGCIDTSGNDRSA
jgi:hypothetical protein